MKTLTIKGQKQTTTKNKPIKAVDSSRSENKKLKK